MDVALLTGRRPADVLKIKRADIRDGALHITPNKTGTKRAIQIVGELKEVIERIDSRTRERVGPMLIQDDNGRPGALTEAAGAQAPGDDRALR
jgi:integrase